VLGLCVSVVACSASEAGEDAPSVAAPVDGHADVGGVNLHYRDYGGEGDLLLFVPGLYMTAQVYDALAPSFTDRYRVLALTNRWHGTSDTTGLDFDLDAVSADIAGFIDRFTEKPAVVAGWSTAGLMLTRLGRQRPDLVRTLVYLNAVWASVPIPPGLPRWPPGLGTVDSVYPSLEAAAKSRQPSLNISSTSKVLDLMAASLVRRDDGMYAWGPPTGTRVEDRVLAYYDSSAVYDGLDLPVLAVQVETARAVAADYEARGFPRDTIDLALRWIREYDDVSRRHGIEALRTAVPDAQVVILDTVNHNFVIENPDVVAPIINDYLDRIAGERD
jgi:pimeloyl-ACP methyl ester carboxylesterase